MPKIYINGSYFEKEEAKISVYDHGLLYGDGVFEGIRAYNGKVFRLKEHIDRLYESAHHLCLEIPMPSAEMVEAVLDAVKVNEKQDAYIRLVITRGVGTLGIDPNKCAHPQVIIIVDDISMYPQDLYENGLDIITASTIRNHPNALNPRIKSLNYLNNILAKMEATRSGCAEAIMLNENGEVAECTGDNIFLVKNGILKTPPPHAGILKGITRGAVMELAEKSDIPVEEPTLTRYDVYSADECFLTGTGAEVIPVVKCDNRVIGNGRPGPITRKLRELFYALVRS